MESTVFVLCKVPSPEVVENVQWFLGDDPPIFEEEVEPKWRRMFRAMEELLPPDEMIPIVNDYLLFNWTCNDWEEGVREYSRALRAAGMAEQAIYYLDDEDEGYLIVQGKNIKSATPVPSEDALSLVNDKLLDWGDENDRVIVANLFSMLG